MPLSIKRFDTATAHWGHEGTILASPVIPDGIRPPFDHAYGYLNCNGTMAGHAHTTDEVYIVFAGSGYCILGGENRPVHAGDVIAIPQNTWHTMLCTDRDNGPFLWAALWWKPLEDKKITGLSIRRFVKEEAVAAHNGTLLAHGVLPEGLKAPFGDAYGYLEKGGVMEAHAHPTEEVYIVYEGRGVMEIDGETAPVGPGDVIAIPRNARHSLAAEADNALLWAALWWE